MNKLLLLSFLVGFLLSCASPPQKELKAKKLSLCPNWEENFSNFQKDLAQTRTEIQEALVTKSKLVCPVKKVRSTKFAPAVSGARWEEVEVPKSEPLFHSMIKFKYVVIPPKRKQPASKKMSTVFVFAGGPGNIYSDALAKKQMNNYQVIIADYIGMGLNQIAPVRSGVDDQVMHLDAYARLIEAIVRREVDSGNVGEFFLEGGSFGSVGATVVGSHLSKMQDSKYRPKLVLLSMVLPFTSLVKTDSPSAPIKAIEWTPRRIDRKMCVLPQGEICFDELVLSKLPEDRRPKIEKAIQNLFQNFQAETQTAMQRFLRDALHWESAQDPQKAGSFLHQAIDDLGNLNFDFLRCWFESEYHGIPWNHRYRSPSFTASIEAHACMVKDSQQESTCSCFQNGPTYFSKDYQIHDPVAVLYINGTEDSQTPLDGAMTHFQSQMKSQKRFIKLCRVGHQVFPDPGSSGSGPLSREKIFDEFQRGGLTEIVGGISLCEESPKRRE